MLVIRAETASDHARVFEVERAAFGRSAEATLVCALRDSTGPGLSLVATLADEIVGHVSFSAVEIESSPRPAAAALGPIAVEPHHQGVGIGSALVRAGLERCADLGWRAVFLVGSPAYYARFGFEPAAARGLCYGVPAFEPAFQCIELEAGALAGCSGRVRFHRAFAEAESS